jgi:Tol biopolymer transport system component
MGKVIGLGAAGVAALAVTATPAGATSPGRNGLLVYEAQLGKHAQLFTISPDGSGVHQLTRFSDSDAVWAAWSPDGNRIAFERDFAGHAGIYTMSADGGGLRALTPTGLNGRPSWSADGKLIVFSTLLLGKRASIWVMAADGSGARRVTSTPLPAKDACGCMGLNSPTFSPNGKRIAFTRVKSERSAAIFTISTAGGGLTQLTPWQNGVADKIDWSPDGSRIAFSSPEFGRPGVSSNVFTVRTNGSGLLKLTDRHGGKINNGLDSWSPDGKKIAFASNRNGTYEIYTMNTNGSGVTQLTHGPQAHHAAWGTRP